MKRRLLAWLYAPLIAVQFLTRIPVRGIPDWAYEPQSALARSYGLYPLIGILVGAIGWGVYVVAHAARLPSIAPAILSVIATACVTGALHEDGFADVCDGLGPHDRETALKAMRDSRVGSFGVIGLWMLLSLKVVALQCMPWQSVGKAMIAAHVLSRWSPLPLAAALPYAQSSAGLGSRIMAELGPRSVVVATVLTGLALVAIWGVPFALRCGAAAVVVSVATGLFYRRKFGGVTGDCLGATNQLVEVVTFFVATM